MKIKSYAKINIGLNILYKRLDSYHELESIMVLVDLYDTMNFEILETNEIKFSCNLDFLNNDNNLIYRIAEYLQDKYYVSNGIKIHLDKIIPVSGGMGGGSSNAATTITSLNKLWNLNLSKEELYKIGIKFGADIPFCINQTPAVIKGIGEIIEPFEFKSDFNIIVVKMPFGLSTKKIFDNFDASIAPQYSINSVKKALIDNNRENFINFLGNNLEEVSIEFKPEIQTVKNILKQNGCFTSLMSGSGPTVLGFIDKSIDSSKLLKILSNEGYEAFCTSIIHSRKE